MVMMSSECFDPSARCNENSGDPELIKVRSLLTVLDQTLKFSDLSSSNF